MEGEWVIIGEGKKRHFMEISKKQYRTLCGISGYIRPGNTMHHLSFCKVCQKIK
jgi:hypothetical protein